MARSMLILSALFNGVAQSGEVQEGLSLLQTQAHLHVQESGSVPAWDLPDPKKQSAVTVSATGGHFEILKNEDQVDFDCAKGKGNWVLMDQMILPIHPQESADLTTNATMIQGMKEEGGRVYAQAYTLTNGVWSQKTYHEFGPVKDEHDCYNRARLDQMCNHWVESIRYSPERKDLRKTFVFYKPTGYIVSSGQENGKKSCYCGLARWLSGDFQKIEVRDPDSASSKAWACRLNAEDTDGITEKTTIEDVFSKQPKEKKTPEERAACKAARAEVKDAKAAVKALRDQLKAARDILKEKRAAKKEVC